MEPRNVAQGAKIGKSDSGLTIILNLDSFRNINNYEFNLLQVKCGDIDSHIETDGQLGTAQDPRIRKLLYLRIGIVKNGEHKKKLVMDYSNPILQWKSKEEFSLS